MRQQNGEPCRPFIPHGWDGAAARRLRPVTHLRSRTGRRIAAHRDAALPVSGELHEDRRAGLCDRYRAGQTQTQGRQTQTQHHASVSQGGTRLARKARPLGRLSTERTERTERTKYGAADPPARLRRADSAAPGVTLL